MCWNWQVSIATFVVVVFVGIFLWCRPRQPRIPKVYDHWVAILATLIGSMQILEFVMWLDQSCSGANQVASFLGFVLLTYVHPWVSYGLAYFYCFWNRRRDELWGMYVAWGVVTLAWSITRTSVYPPGSAYLCSRPEPDMVHLDWPWDRHLLPNGSVITLYYVFTFTPLLAMGWGRGLFWMAWSAFVGLMAHVAGHGGPGSMYCWMGAFSGFWQIFGVPELVQCCKKSGPELAHDAELAHNTRRLQAKV